MSWANCFVDWPRNPNARMGFTTGNRPVLPWDEFEQIYEIERAKATSLGQVCLFD
jgi:hypothetical protein